MSDRPIDRLPLLGSATGELDLDRGPFTVFSLKADETGDVIYAHALHRPSDADALTWYAWMLDAADDGDVTFTYRKGDSLTFFATTTTR